VVADNPGGTLVVAGGSTAIADVRGGFTVFNVPAGSQTVTGYLTGVNLESKTVDVAATKTTEGVELTKVGDAIASVSGSVTFVNPGSGVTSVILAVKDTFDPDSAKGESPPGLKAEGVTGPFTIANVPNGTYIVLAAFDNDGLVRDPDTSIGGTGRSNHRRGGGLRGPHVFQGHRCARGVRAYPGPSAHREPDLRVGG
jgi:hypothetical protein